MSSGPKLTVEASEDVVDHVVGRGRRVGRGWLSASAVAFAAAITFGAARVGVLAFVAGVALLSTGLMMRARYWRRARADLGEYALRRGRWREAERDADDPGRLVTAVLVIVLVVALRLWV